MKKKKNLTNSVFLLTDHTIPLDNAPQEELTNIKRAKIIRGNNIKDIVNEESKEIYNFPDNKKELNIKENEPKKIKRKNSDNIDSKQIKRYFTKKKNTIFPRRK